MDRFDLPRPSSRPRCQVLLRCQRGVDPGRRAGGTGDAQRQTGAARWGGRGGVGAVSRTELAEAAGARVYNGIVTDRYLKTNLPDVYAAGDVANSSHPPYGQRFRLEHWSAAGGHGRTAALNMLGQSRAYDKVPYFVSDQYDFSMECRGRTSGGEEPVVRPGESNEQFIAFWIRDSQVAAAMNANVWDQNETPEWLVASGAVADKARLVDAGLDLALVVDPPTLAQLGQEAGRG